MFLTRLLIIMNTESWNLRLKGLENVNAMKTGLEALTPSPALSSCVWPRLRAVTGLTELLCTCTLSALPLALLSEHTDSVYTECLTPRSAEWAHGLCLRLGFSWCSSQAPERWLSSCGSQAQLLWGMWNLPGPGIEPVSAALAVRFLPTAPTGKSQQ